MKTLRRTITPQIRVLDEKEGLVEYVASDATIDSYREVIRADGWRFNRFKRNAPFVDSHEYGTIEKLLGSVVEFKVKSGQLVETVKWAHDVPENRLAQLGYAMTKAGHLKAVSVGFIPTKTLTSTDRDFRTQVLELGYAETDGIRAIYVEQEQIELSACVIGANPAALAKSYKDGLLTESDLDFIFQERNERETAKWATDAAAAHEARQRQRESFLRQFTQFLER